MNENVLRAHEEFEDPETGLQASTADGIEEQLRKAYTAPFMIMLFSLIFNGTRPDRLIPGGEVLMYLPVAVIGILLMFWLASPQKALRDGQTKLFLFFILMMAIHVLFARHSMRAFAVVKSVSIFMLTSYLFSVQFLDTFFKLKRYIKLMVCVAMFFAVMGLLGKGKVSIPLLRDENDFCLFLNIILPFAFFIGQFDAKKYEKLFFNLLALTIVAANVATKSRGGFIGLVAVGFFFLHRSHKKLIGFLFICLVSIGALVLAPSDYWQEMKTIQTEGTTQGTGKNRIEYWKAGLKMFLDNPLFGVGPRNYGVWVPEYHAVNPKKEWGRVPHSLYIDLLSEMGLVGAIVFFSILRLNVKCHRRIYEIHENSKIVSEAEEGRDSRIFRAIRELYLISLGLSGAMIAYLVTGAFISVLWYGYFWSLTALWLATVHIAEKLEALQYAEKAT